MPTCYKCHQNVSPEAVGEYRPGDVMILCESCLREVRPGDAPERVTIQDVWIRSFSDDELNLLPRQQGT